MLHACFELSIQCPKCDAAIPLNGPWLTAHCDKCQADVDVPAEFWKDLLEDALQEVKTELKETEGQNSTVFGTFRTAFMYGRLHSRCEECKEPINAPGDVVKEPYTHKCPKCGLETPVAPVPDWFRKELPATFYTVNAITLEGEQEGSGAKLEPVVFSCLKCGGALDVDGSERVIKCKYCGVQVYIPDDLWLRLHPAKQKRRWFLTFDEKQVKNEDE